MQCLLPPAISTCGLSSTHLHSWWKCCASVTVVLRPSGCFFKTSTPPPTRSKVTPPDPPSTCSAPATGKPLVVRESPNQKCITNSHTHTQERHKVHLRWVQYCDSIGNGGCFKMYGCRIYISINLPSHCFQSTWRGAAGKHLHSWLSRSPLVDARALPEPINVPVRQSTFWL